MAEFCEFHDSILEGMESRDGKLVMQFDAYRQLRPDVLNEDSWTGWTQRIEITIDDAIVQSAFQHFPIQIYDGSLKVT